MLRGSKWRGCTHRPCRWLPSDTSLSLRDTRWGSSYSSWTLDRCTSNSLHHIYGGNVQFVLSHIRLKERCLLPTFKDVLNLIPPLKMTQKPLLTIIATSDNIKESPAGRLILNGRMYWTWNRNNTSKLLKCSWDKNKKGFKISWVKAAGQRASVKCGNWRHH